MLNMPKDILEFILKASSRHFVILFVILIVTGMSVVFYESYTGHFRLSKLNTASKILVETSKIEVKPGSKEEKLQKEIVVKVRELVFDSNLGHGKNSFLISFFLGIPLWLLIGSPLLFLVFVQPEKQVLLLALIYFFIATMSSVIGALMPEFIFPLSHLLVYPACFLFLTFLGGLIYDFFTFDKR